MPHSAPRFTGKSVRSLTSTVPSGAGVRFIPHCRAQYGQCVGVAVVCIPFSLLRPCYARDGSLLRGRDGNLPVATPPA
ncbi:putative Formate dehydrogenase subunit alpha [Streptomyces afghaniensis 772]|uniref:Putative Formate dehydrogenase subunit alpha n=1 Tax=Streptomyces afghaniensis 772 TaxID=1283301 RepID=S4NDY6_9ACTN|nr:putative Formate dehydrogenase subunit alpha [Streptomyces afghaniensis 772]